MHFEIDLRYSRHELTEPEERTEQRMTCRALDMEDSSYCTCGDH